MKKRHLVVAGCVALIATTAGAQSNVYRWVDKDGKTHFTDTPPPADAKSITQKRLGDAPPVDLPYAVRTAMDKNPVTLYSAPSCGEACISARDLLTQRGIPFSERNAQANAQAQEALKKLVGGLEVPVLTVGTTTLKGYESGQWHAALSDAGYPRTRLPGQPPSAPAAQPATPAGASPAK
jgi:glutaredoxin